MSYIQLNEGDYWAPYTNYRLWFRGFTCSALPYRWPSLWNPIKVFSQKSKICSIVGCWKYINPTTKALTSDLTVCLRNLNAKLRTFRLFSGHFGLSPERENEAGKMSLIQYGCFSVLPKFCSESLSVQQVSFYHVLNSWIMCWPFFCTEASQISILLPTF